MRAASFCFLLVLISLLPGCKDKDCERCDPCEGASRGGKAHAASAQAAGVEDEDEELYRSAAAEPLPIPSSALVVPPIASGFQPQNAVTAVRIGGWNIEWLGNKGQRKHSGHNVLQKAEDLAAYIRESKVDVLGVMEIGGEGPKTNLRNAILTQVAAKLSENPSAPTWSYLLFPNRGNDQQVCGVLWNSEKVSFRGSEELAIPASPAGGGTVLLSRHPRAVHFSAGIGQTDFAVIVVHLKCCGFESHREKEAKAIINALPAIRTKFGNEKDVIILGDSNMNRATETGVAAFRTAGYADLNSADQKTWLEENGTSGSSALDRAFVPTLAGAGTSPQPEFGQSALDVYRGTLTPAKHRKLLSDHFMIRTIIAVSADDDQ